VYILLAQKVSRCQQNSLDALLSAADAIFSRTGRFATGDVVLHLLQTKCLFIIARQHTDARYWYSKSVLSLLYQSINQSINGLKALPLMKTDLSSIDFVVNRFLWNCFRQIMWTLLNLVSRTSVSIAPAVQLFSACLQSLTWNLRIIRISYKLCDDIVMCKELPVLYYVNSLLVKFIVMCKELPVLYYVNSLLVKFIA